MSFITFGEIMLRLSPSENGEKLILANHFSVGYAGSESNVATSLACLGNTVDFVSKVPENPLGKAALSSLNRFRISTDHSIFGGSRMGTYFIELGSSIRPSRVVYDRQDSAISEIKSGEFNWKDILKNKKWLHLSGITPALSDQCAHETILAAQTAKEMGVAVSFDLNFRRSLWSDPQKARDIFDTIIKYCDIVFGNAGVMKDVYDLSFEGADLKKQTEKVLKKAQALFQLDHIAFTIRKHHSASQNQVQGMAIYEGQLYTSEEYNVQVSDRFGTGDAFAAAYLHSLNRDWEVKKAISFSTAAFALKHTISGDIHTSTEEEILNIMSGNLSGHVIR